MSSPRFFGGFDASVNVESTDQDSEVTINERVEENCDRVSESYGWGAYEYEEVDCSDADDDFGE